MVSKYKRPSRPTKRRGLGDSNTIADKTKEFVEYPLVFGAGVGIANGLLAKARGMQFSARATLATALVLALGETILALDETDDDRHGRALWQFGLLSGLGVLMGLSVFTNWRLWSGGDRPAYLFAMKTTGIDPQKDSAITPGAGTTLMPITDTLIAATA